MQSKINLRSSSSLGLGDGVQDTAAATRQRSDRRACLAYPVGRILDDVIVVLALGGFEPVGVCSNSSLHSSVGPLGVEVGYDELEVVVV